mmetsp:Transcript_27282/g.51938  ORF Transcript_27282/g.51938 Transcript_27282/m.51938 type:complete len:136 (+) Transcript_27282:63-470(+)
MAPNARNTSAPSAVQVHNLRGLPTSELMPPSSLPPHVAHVSSQAEGTDLAHPATPEEHNYFSGQPSDVQLQARNTAPLTSDPPPPSEFHGKPPRQRRGLTSKDLSTHESNLRMMNSVDNSVDTNDPIALRKVCAL